MNMVTSAEIVEDPLSDDLAGGIDEERECARVYRGSGGLMNSTA